MRALIRRDFIGGLIAVVCGWLGLPKTKADQIQITKYEQGIDTGPAQEIQLAFPEIEPLTYAFPIAELRTTSCMYLVSARKLVDLHVTRAFLQITAKPEAPLCGRHIIREMRENIERQRLMPTCGNIEGTYAEQWDAFLAELAKAPAVKKFGKMTCIGRHMDAETGLVYDSLTGKCLNG